MHTSSKKKDEVTFFKFLFCVHVCPPPQMYVYAPTCMQCHQRPKEGVRLPVTGVEDGFKLLCGCSELNPNPLVEQPVSHLSNPLKSHFQNVLLF